jgi:RNA polymerase sigma factor (sigma-70 family)
LGNKFKTLVSHETEEIAQETFLKAYRKLHSFREDSAFYTWLWKIACNAAKDYFDAQTKQRVVESIEEYVVIEEDDGKPPERIPRAHGLITYWMGRKPIRIRGPLQRKRWEEHGVDPEKIRSILAGLRTRGSEPKTQESWSALTTSLAEVLTDLRPGRGRRPKHSKPTMCGYLMLTAMYACKTPRDQALYLAGMLTALLPGPKGRPKAGASQIDRILGTSSAKPSRSASPRPQ